MLRENNSTLRKVQLAGDIGITAASFFMAYFVRHTGFSALEPVVSLPHHLFLLYIIIPVWAFLLLVNGGYRSIRVESLVTTIGPIIRTVIIGGGVLMAVIFAFKLNNVSRGVVISFLIINAVLLALLRMAMYYLFHYIRKRGHNYRTILIIGTNDRAQRFADTVRKHVEWGLRIEGFVDIDPGLVGRNMHGLPVVGVLDDLPDIISSRQIDEIVFVGPRSWHGYIEEIVLSCEDVGLKTRIACDFYPTRFSRIHLDNLEEWPLLTISPPPHYGEMYILKRTIDITFSLIFLAITAPIYIVLALVIKLTSDGPVFFRQYRCGMNGRKFNLLKFRTMVKDADRMKGELKHINEMSGPVFKAKNDPRITPVGRLMRKFSLDELPQFINVLKGDMSIVGPRPPLPDEVKNYDYKQRRRLSVPPGITCLWQVSGRNEIGFQDWVQLDLEYIDKWSLELDFKIMLKTVPTVLKGSGM